MKVTKVVSKYVARGSFLRALSLLLTDDAGHSTVEPSSVSYFGMSTHIRLLKFEMPVRFLEMTHMKPSQCVRPHNTLRMSRIVNAEGAIEL